MQVSTLTHKPLMGLWQVLLLLAGSFLITRTSAECQCRAVTVPVCGQDGNSYQNRCFADCQGVTVVAWGACTLTSGAGVAMAQAFSASVTGEEGTLQASMATYSLSSFTTQQLDGIAAAAASIVQGFDTSSPLRLVTVADMNRFASDGLVLVGTLRPNISFEPVAAPVPDDVELRSQGNYENYGATEAVGTPDGFVYKARSLVTEAYWNKVAAAKAAAAAAAGIDSSSSGLISEDAFIPEDVRVAAAAAGVGVDEAVDGAADAASGNSDGTGGGNQGDEDSSQGPAGASAAAGGRKLLKVFPPDSRMELRAHQRTLVRAVGRITFSVGKSDYFCSGAMIGRFTVLTAAHCVLSLTTPGVTASTWKFSPDQTRVGQDPRFGRGLATRFYFDSRFWSSGAWWLWDMVVVVLDQPLGAKTGFFSVGYARAGYTGSLYTAGYPADKPLWSFWWIPGGKRCNVTDTDGTDALMMHKCDTYPGQSGSPMWVPNTSTIISVVSWETADINGACAVNAFWYSFIKKHRRAIAA